MKVYFKIFLISLFFVLLIMFFLTFGKFLLSYFSFLKPGIDVFFSIVGGDNPYIKFFVFFLFWFVVIFGFSYLSYLVMNTYIWSTNLGHEKKSSLERILSASKQEIIILILAVDYIMISTIILVTIFQKKLISLWQIGLFSFNQHLVIFWISFFISIFIFLIILNLFAKKMEEYEVLRNRL